ncbi:MULTISPECIES: alpha/beta hydrolase [Pseudonocardia]|uniref:Monoterpene epsilon-lactone hydrolase n=2 Tax=Pseudonocardia TaxID=1847 RepID=A0A1Y2N011_PSEAH|nr:MULTISPECIES: alpha/beta hydrolase [Pseudonocardia]OSY40760.1 Monoterpene epsilon-lactone hydrolase [Pseudonocardia autotrophica]TDN71933.1 acetyl esterase/lipase [Pseudonocardia autotrophica]BBG02620.1 esterase [Pseudonocardia autotrophica]GEC24679.1 esterase [Pseudonocardia saturnea]
MSPLPGTSPEFRDLVDQLRARPFEADTRPVADLRAGFERFAAQLADPPEVHTEQVEANGVPAEWARRPAGTTRGVLLYLHGGGFTIGSVPAFRDLSARLAVRTGCAVLTVEYRRAPEHRFPAALDDAVAAYEWLRAAGAGPVVVAGDSAGGGLALSTALVARDRGLDPPDGLALISPLLDLAHTGRSVQMNAPIDPIVTPAGSHAYAERYLGADGDPYDPLASPLFADLTGLPPTYVQVGTTECLLDDALRAARRLRDAGVDTDLDVWPDMLHIMPFFASRVPEGDAALQAVVNFVRSRTDGDAR